MSMAMPEHPQIVGWFAGIKAGHGRELGAGLANFDQYFRTAHERLIAGIDVLL